MSKIIACRPDFYDLPLAEAAAELNSIGIRNLEIRLPEDDIYDPIVKTIRDQNMEITSLSSGLRVGDSESYSKLCKAIEAAGKHDIGVIFCSAGLAEDAGYEQGILILKELGELAAKSNTVISLETHKPFCHNSEAVINTMEEVDSPGIGYNYDTANIFYYNEKGTDGIEELRKTADYVTSVHLKESAAGEPGSFNFPIFGEGIVRFDEVFDILEERDFHGPFTLELEGPVVSGYTTEEQTVRVKACLDYIRAIVSSL